MKRSSLKDASPNIWEAISGRLEEGEDPKSALLREIEEETGLDVKIDPRPVDAYYAKRLGEDMIVIVYKASYLSGEVAMSEEHDDYQWFTIEEFENRSPLKLLVKAAKNILT